MEVSTMRAIMLACGRGTARLFRANCGQAWQGRIIGRTATSITLENPRVFHGMPEGFSDLVGWRTVRITADMVGRDLAVFVALEVKAPTRSGANARRARTIAAQTRFLDVVAAAGGIAAVAHAPADAEAALDSVRMGGTVPP